jgi:hypothetical protein
VKKLLFLVLLLSGCQSTDPKCLDGYLVYSINNFAGFCTQVYVFEHGIEGYHCYDGPNQSSRVEARLLLKEGYIMETKCYNILSREKMQ